MEKDILDNKSIVSTRSLAESEYLSKSKIFGSKSNDDPNKEKMMEKLTKMEEKIDFLVKNKLKIMYAKTKPNNRFSPKPFFGSGSFSRTL